MTFDMNAAMDNWRREQSQTMAKISENKVMVLEALRAHGIERVEIEYSGSGDSGQINEISNHGFARDAQGLPTFTDKWPEVRIMLIGENEPRTLEDTVEWMAWQLLTVKHEGWENNDGGQGTIAFDVPSNMITLSHGQNYTETTHTDTEI